MWMYDHLQKLFSTEVSIEKYRPAKSNLVTYVLYWTILFTNKSFKQSLYNY